MLTTCAWLAAALDTIAIAISTDRSCRVLMGMFRVLPLSVLARLRLRLASMWLRLARWQYLSARALRGRRRLEWRVSKLDSFARNPAIQDVYRGTGFANNSTVEKFADPAIP